MAPRRKKPAVSSKGTGKASKGDKSENGIEKSAENGQCQGPIYSWPAVLSGNAASEMPLTELQNQSEEKPAKGRARTNASKVVNEEYSEDDSNVKRRSSRLSKNSNARTRIGKENDEYLEDIIDIDEDEENLDGSKKPKQKPDAPKRRKEGAGGRDNKKSKRTSSGQKGNVSSGSSTERVPDPNPEPKGNVRDECNEMFESNLTQDHEEGVVQAGPPGKSDAAAAIPVCNSFLLNTSRNTDGGGDVASEDNGANLSNEAVAKLNFPGLSIKGDEKERSVPIDMFMKEYLKLHKKYETLKERKFEEVEAYVQEQNKKFETYVNAAEELMQHLREKNSYLRSKVVEAPSRETMGRVLLLESKNAEVQKDLLQEQAKNTSLKEELQRVQQLLSEQVTMQHEKCEKEEGNSSTSTIHSKGQHSNAQQSDWAIHKDLIQVVRTSQNTDQAASFFFQMLLQHMLGLKFTIGEEGNQLHLLMRHESTGYSFKLKQGSIENDGELVYQCVCLGTLQRIAPEWMKQDIIFNIAQAKIFFDRILKVANG